MVFHGTNSRIFNAPIDLFIEDYIYNSLPELKPYQFLSLINLDKVSLQAVTDKAILEVTPQKIVSKVKVYNAVSARLCDNLYGISTEKEYPLSPTEKKQVDEFWEEFNEYRNDKKPGEEYELIQHWAEDLELDDFFKLKKVAQEDSMQEEKASNNANYGMTEDEKEKLNIILEEESIKDVDRMLLSLMVSAYKALKDKSLDEIEGIAFELGMKAKYGISTDQKGIQIDSLPNQLFDGQELLAWYYTSWAIYKPEFIHELGMPYQTVFELVKRVVESTHT
jgi:hypothetical protein